MLGSEVQIEKANGLVDYTEVAYGKRAGYLFGWFNCVLYLIPITTILSWVTAMYTLILIGNPNPQNSPLTWILACVYMLTIYVINYYAPFIAGKLQVGATVIKLIPLSLVALVGMFVGIKSGVGIDNFTNADVWEGMKQKMGSIIFAYILVGIIIVFAFLALIIPGIYLANVFLIIAPVIVIGRKSVGDAMGECFRLMKGNWWKTFLFVFVLNIIGSVISLVFTLPSSIYNAVITSLSLTGGVAMNQYLTIFFSMIQSVGYVLVYSLMYIGLGLVYFNLVEQKDSTGLLNELDSIGDSE